MNRSSQTCVRAMSSAPAAGLHSCLTSLSASIFCISSMTLTLSSVAIWHPICRKKISFFCTKKSASSHHLGNRRTFSASVKCHRTISVSERHCHIFRDFGDDVLLLHRPHHPVKCVDSADSIIIRLRILV